MCGCDINDCFSSPIQQIMKMKPHNMNPMTLNTIPLIIYNAFMLHGIAKQRKCVLYLTKYLTSTVPSSCHNRTWDFLFGIVPTRAIQPPIWLNISWKMSTDAWMIRLRKNRKVLIATLFSGKNIQILVLQKKLFVMRFHLNNVFTKMRRTIWLSTNSGHNDELIKLFKI